MRIRQAVIASVLSVVAVAILGESPALSQGKSQVTVSIDGLIFEEPDDSSRVVLRVRAGEVLDVVSEKGDWIRVRLPRGTGWILRKIVRQEGEQPDLAGVGGAGAESVTVVDEYADVRAGPGEAYLAIKRVFKGESFAVASRSDDGEWVQIEVSGDQGWVARDQVLRSDAVFERDKAADGGSTTTEPDIAPPEGIDEEAEAEYDKETGDSDGLLAATGLKLRVGGLIQFAQQDFDSDSPEQRLDQYSTSSTLFGADITAEYWFIRYAGVAVDYRFGLGLPIVASFPEAEAELQNSTQRLVARLGGRYTFGGRFRSPWIGLSVGYLYQTFNIQSTSVPLFVDNTYTGFRLGGEGSFPVGPLTLFVAGWTIVGGDLTQEMDGNEALSGATLAELSQFGAELGAELELSSLVGIYVRATLDREKSTFSGEAARDPSISEAVNTDQFVSISTGVYFLPF